MQYHLNELLDTHDPQQILYHRSIASWIRDFLGLGDRQGVEEKLRNVKDLQDHPPDEPPPGHYMPKDSGSMDPDPAA